MAETGSCIARRRHVTSRPESGAMLRKVSESEKGKDIEAECFEHDSDRRKHVLASNFP